MRRSHVGGILDEESLGRNQWTGIMMWDRAMWQDFIGDPSLMMESMERYCKEASWRRSHGGGIKVEGSSDDGDVH
jgi:hypothetical protein